MKRCIDMCVRYLGGVIGANGRYGRVEVQKVYADMDHRRWGVAASFSVYMIDFTYLRITRLI